MLAIAGSLAAKKIVPASAGTLPTHTPLFVLLLIGTRDRGRRADLRAGAGAGAGGRALADARRCS